ncbi:Transcriptional regulator PadR-like family protein [Streptomyces sp. ADI96-02]|uniref:PadR family transcriptional regulator n=1 Tax=Streptomyces sp. ADI96-02 TaxID=1522760 RepID=UPI000F555568|nr:PadR family transcriptional regulator [Streptomyces sp. ADI96-02]RPK54562.1 Transcriptional regulator PadR-like family protein [Streptomyces sp. ADI96-02]
MSLRIALLGTLAHQGPASGYELAKHFDTSVNLVWQARHSQIYPELAKMAQSGAVTVEDAGGGRGRKVYTVTDAGRDEIARWVTAEDPYRSVRNESGLRAFLVTLIPPDEAAAVMRAQEARHGAALDALLKVKDDVAARTAPGSPPFGAYALDLGLRTTRMLQEWAADTAEQLEKRAAASEQTP